MRCLRLIPHGCILIRPFQRQRCSALRSQCTFSCLRERRPLGIIRALATTASPPQHGTKSQVPTTQLRPYQEEIIQAVLDYLAKGEKRLGISLATGGGKTVIFSHLIDRVPSPTASATRTLIIAHKQELVDQAVNHCRRLYPGSTIETEMAEKHASGFADITVASVMTLNSIDRLLKFDPSDYKLLIIDEAHHVVAPSYLNVLRYFRLIDSEEKSHVALVGMSATLSRSDGLSLGKALDHIVYHRDYLDMIEDNWLSNVVFTTVQSGANLHKVKTGRGDFLTGSLSRAINTPETNAITVRAWLEKAQGRKSTLVFAVDFAHVASLTATFRQHGIDARFVTKDTHSDTRKQRVQAFRDGEFPVLLNCGIFTEGTDIPNIDCILLARPTRSRNLLVQMIGRGLRLHAGKQNCHVIDMVSALETGIVTTPTLFGLNPDELVDETDVPGMKTRKDKRENEREREQQAQKVTTCAPRLSGNVVLTDYEDVHDLIQDTSGERHIRAMSPFAWVQIDQSRYVLSANAGDLELTKSGEEYLVLYKERLPESARSKSPSMRPRRVAKASTFDQAVRAADSFAKERFVFELISKTARWRSYPASAGQITFLNCSRGDDEKLEPGSTTKGRAGDWITKIRHGARGRFNRIVGEKRKVERVQRRQAAFQHAQSRAQVTVGPIA